MKSWMGMMKNLTMLTQFSLSFITPLLLCLAGSWMLNVRAGMGGWVFIPGFFFGMGGSFMVAYKLYLSINHKQKKNEKKHRISFNSHF